MKKRNNPRGTKARVQAYKKRLGYIGTAVMVAILIAVVAISSFLIYTHLNSTPNQAINPEQTNNQPSQPKAAIVDHLSLTYPNQTFIQTATSALEEAGYTVDYYPGEEVNVEFYRNLPTHGYGLIILRVHSSATVPQGTQLVKGSVCLFTSEPYDKGKYVYEQLTDQLLWAAYSNEDVESGNKYFGIAPLFVTKSMRGRFQDAVIIMTGCEGLADTGMAEAFIQKGTKVYISWSGPVLASHTDQTTTYLLKQLITQKQTIGKALIETTKAVGPDPAYHSLLLVLPEEAWEYKIPPK